MPRGWFGGPRMTTDLRPQDLDRAQAELDAGRGWYTAVTTANELRAAEGMPTRSRRSFARALRRRLNKPRGELWAPRSGRPRYKAPLTPDECKFAIHELGAAPRRRDYDRVALHISDERVAAGGEPQRSRFSGTWLQTQLAAQGGAP